MARRREPLCLGCLRLLRRLGSEPLVLSGVRAWAPVAYAGPARDLVGALKFRGATAVAETMAAQIAANVPASMLAGALVPVPLHPRRRRRRGYNQAALIADALARRTGLDVADCLRRAGSAVTQVGRDRRERRLGPAGNMELHAAAPGRVVLVDDVATTGATLAACATVLRQGGSIEVAALVFARTIGR